MKIIKKGATRLVFLIGNYAFKVPNFTYCHLHFLHGCYACWSERDYTKRFKVLSDVYEKISPTIFCSWFGLLSVQKRVVELDRDLTEDECFYFFNQTEDTKMQNFGYLKGKLVCIDYA